MSRASALTISVILGFVILGIVGVVALLLFPFEQAFAPTPTVTSTSTIAPSPTIYVPLPTARSETPTKGPPTPTNTRLPTATARPTRTASPTGAFALPTIAVPTSTPTLSPTVTTAPVPALAPRHYVLVFELDETVIDRGDCTNLRWQATGPITLWLDGSPVEGSGKMRVCPRNDTTYTIEFQVAGSAQVQSKSVTLDVKS